MPTQSPVVANAESDIPVSPVKDACQRSGAGITHVLPTTDSLAAPSRTTTEPIFAGAGRHYTKKQSPRWLLPTVLGSTLAVAIGAIVLISYRGSRDQSAFLSTQTQSASFYGAIAPVEKVVAPQYTDANSDMLADSPSDPEVLIDPDTLVVAHYEGDYEEDPRVNWDAFRAHLEAATSRKIVLQEYLHTAAEVEAVAAGRIHIVAPHAADVPCLVNYAGLIPVAALGTYEGPNGNHMVIAVRSDSEIKSLADLAGKTLTCTRPHSITGYRAAVTILSQQTDMRPDSDYSVYFSDGQARSIRGLAAHWYEAAAISYDKLQWALEGRVIDESQYRLIYESEIIPRLTIGHIHNLSPQLAAKVSAAVLSFDNERTAHTDWNAPPMRFHAVNYRRDFQFVRKMDNSFDPRCGKLLVARFDH